MMIICWIWLAMISSHEAYKILVVFPRPSRSHGILGDGIVRHLLKDGHEVTYISPFPYKSPSSSLRVIDVGSNIKAVPKTILKFESVLNKEIDFSNQFEFTSMMIDMTNFTIHNEMVRKLLNDPSEEFDLVMVEWIFTDLISSFAAVFNCPLIWVSTMEVHWKLLRLVDQPPNPAYTADITVSYSLPPYTFWQRVTELYNQVKEQYYRYMYFNNIERRIYEEALAPIMIKRGRQPPSYHDVQFNSSLVLANTHVSLGQAISLPPNCIAVGGYHIEESVQPLPKDLKKIMDDAKNGVIFFSMGSNLKSKDIPKALKDDLLSMFGELNQTVLWKFEEELPNTPKNVHILQWVPQQGVLAHPNTILFITHGGLLSTTEAIHFGVPIVGIPVFGDQLINVARAVQRGFGYKVELSYQLAERLKSAIIEVTTHSKYTEKVKELSFVYHHRPVTPDKEILHWVRHVIETRGAPHLRSPALKVPFYQKLYLDLLALVVIVSYLVVKLLNHIFKLYCATIQKFEIKKKVI